MRTQDILKELRSERGLSLMEAAALLKVSYQELEKWEKGYRVPTKYSLEKLSNFYQTPVEEIAKITFAYKTRLLVQHIKDNWIKFLFVGLFVSVLISWFLSFALNITFGLYNANRPKDYVDHHLRVMNETDSVKLRYSFDAEFVSNDSLDTDIVIYIDIPRSSISRNESVTISTLDGIVIESETEVFITHFECQYNPNGDKSDSFIVQMTLGDSLGQRFAASNFFSFNLDTDEDYFEVDGNNKLSGDIVVYGGEE